MLWAFGEFAMVVVQADNAKTAKAISIGRNARVFDTVIFISF